MKKFLLSLAVLAASAFALSAQETLTVYEGTATNNTVPAYIFYWDDFTRSQFVIPAADLEDMAGGSISAIKFYTTTDNIPYSSVSTADVYLMEVEYTSISDFEPKANGTIVYQGTVDVVSADGGGEMTIQFATPYTYGGGNLLIGIENTTDAGYKNIYFYGQNVSGASVAGYQSSSLDNVTASQKNFIPKTTFTYEPSELDEYAASVTPEALAFGKVYINNESEMVVTLKNKGANAFTPVITGLEAPFSTTYEAAELASKESVEIPVKFAPTAYNEYTGTMTINCGEAGTFTVALSGNCPNELSLTVCNGEDTNEHAPIYGYYTDTEGTFVQMIYPADMLAEVANANITGIMFYANAATDLNNPRITLGLKETELTAFNEPESAIAAPDNLLTDFTSVCTTRVENGITELYFEFDEPYTYEGGNLALQTNVTIKGRYQHLNFYGVNQENYTAYTYWGPSFNLTFKFLPKMTVIYTKAEEPVEEPVTVTGTVKDEDNMPLEGVNVTLTVNVPNRADGDATTYTTTTDAEGVYTMEVTPVEGATYDMAFEKDGYDSQTFEDVDLEDAPDVILKEATFTGINDINSNNVVSVEYINAMGQTSTRPFEGINIVVTRNADGTTSTTKIVK